MDDLVERLKLIAKQHSETARMMAQSKSLRQAGHEPPRVDLYAWPTPEQTTEWLAAERIKKLEAVLKRLLETTANNAIYHSTDHAEARAAGYATITSSAR